MKIIKKIHPGANGSKRYLKKFGKKLVCVRYRIDEQNQRRITTVEVIVDESNYSPIYPELRQLFPVDHQKVFVRIDIEDLDLRFDIKNKGGKWDGKQKLWRIPYKIARELGITNRIVYPNMDTTLK